MENADLQKLEAVLARPDTEKAKAKHTVREPVDIYVEVEGGREPVGWGAAKASRAA